MSLEISFVSEVKQAERARQELITQSALSVPRHEGEFRVLRSSALPTTGLMRVLLGGVHHHLSDREVVARFEEVLEFVESEAERLKKLKAGEYRSVSIGQVGHESIKNVLCLDRVAGFAFIGFAGTNALLPDDYAQNGVFGWQNASRTATHLKTGSVEHLLLPVRGVNGCKVPVGSFAVAEAVNVFSGTYDMNDLRPIETARIFMETPGLDYQLIAQNNLA